MNLYLKLMYCVFVFDILIIDLIKGDEVSI